MLFAQDFGDGLLFLPEILHPVAHGVVPLRGFVALADFFPHFDAAVVAEGRDFGFGFAAPLAEVSSLQSQLELALAGDGQVGELVNDGGSWHGGVVQFGLGLFRFSRLHNSQDGPLTRADSLSRL